MVFFQSQAPDILNLVLGRPLLNFRAFRLRLKLTAVVIAIAAMLIIPILPIYIIVSLVFGLSLHFLVICAVAWASIHSGFITVKSIPAYFGIITYPFKLTNVPFAASFWSIAGLVFMLFHGLISSILCSIESLAICNDGQSVSPQLMFTYAPWISIIIGSSFGGIFLILRHIGQVRLQGLTPFLFGLCISVSPMFLTRPYSQLIGELKILQNMNEAFVWWVSLDAAFMTASLLLMLVWLQYTARYSWKFAGYLAAALLPLGVLLFVSPSLILTGTIIIHFLIWIGSRLWTVRLSTDERKNLLEMRKNALETAEALKRRMDG